MVAERKTSFEEWVESKIEGATIGRIHGAYKPPAWFSGTVEDLRKLANSALGGLVQANDPNVVADAYQAFRWAIGQLPEAERERFLKETHVVE
jgi:hypothetical protein